MYNKYKTFIIQVILPKLIYLPIRLQKRYVLLVFLKHFCKKDVF